MGSSQQAPYVPPAQVDPYVLAQEKQAQDADIATSETDLAGQTNTLQRMYGAAATGSTNGTSSVAYMPLGAVAGVR